MNFLVDTNILTRLAEPGHPMHRPALDAVDLLVGQGHKLHKEKPGAAFPPPTRPRSI